MRFESRYASEKTPSMRFVTCVRCILDAVANVQRLAAVCRFRVAFAEVVRHEKLVGAGEAVIATTEVVMNSQALVKFLTLFINICKHKIYKWL